MATDSTGQASVWFQGLYSRATASYSSSSQDALAAVWHLLEFFGNTVLFVLCGVFAFESAQIVRWSDYGWLLVFYILANLARGFMIGVLWPLVNCVSGSDVTSLACKWRPSPPFVERSTSP